MFYFLTRDGLETILDDLDIPGCRLNIQNDKEYLRYYGHLFLRAVSQAGTNRFDRLIYFAVAVKKV